MDELGGVLYDGTDGSQESGYSVAEALQIPLFRFQKNHPDDGTFVFVSTDKVGIVSCDSGKFGRPVFIDFEMICRSIQRSTGGMSGFKLMRAVGSDVADRQTILDATAGYGEDSAVLSYFGSRVVMCERSPVMHLMIENALERARKIPGLGAFVERLDLRYGNSIDILTNERHMFDVVYVDPMYPKIPSSALVKKHMRVLRSVVGDDNDSESLFTVACSRARRRVVVKRMRNHPPITSDRVVHHVIEGKSSRFDVYCMPNAV